MTKKEISKALVENRTRFLITLQGSITASQNVCVAYDATDDEDTLRLLLTRLGTLAKEIAYTAQAYKKKTDALLKEIK